MASWVTGVEAITLFVADVGAARDFYRKAFTADLVFEDDVSAVFRFGSTLINLLAASAAGELVEPLGVGTNGAPRMVLTMQVDDIDSRCAALTDLGIALVNGPIDRPWGRRTAAFADPDGHVWELAQDLA